VTCGNPQARAAHRPDHDRDARLRGAGPVVGVSEATADLNQGRLEPLHAGAVLEPRQVGVLALAAHVPGPEPKLDPAVGGRSAVATARASSAGFQNPTLSTWAAAAAAAAG